MQGLRDTPLISPARERFRWRRGLMFRASLARGIPCRSLPHRRLPFSPYILGQLAARTWPRRALQHLRRACSSSSKITTASEGYSDVSTPGQPFLIGKSSPVGFAHQGGRRPAAARRSRGTKVGLEPPPVTRIFHRNKRG